MVTIKKSRTVFWSAILLVIFSQLQKSESLKDGRCPRMLRDGKSCGDGEKTNQCLVNEDCSGDSVCCSTGCNNVCVIPLFSACEHSRRFFEKLSTDLPPKDGEEVRVPQCDSNGKYEEIQCDSKESLCWCVDESGFEKSGTRAFSRQAVNCSRVNEKCSGAQCRMLCPYEFELNDEGCEVCSCRDICSGVKCPTSLECQLEQLACSSEPCPPVPVCKKPRTLDSLCDIGTPFTIPETGNPYLCGNIPGKPQCPSGFTCNVNQGDEYGVCCGSALFYEKPGECPLISNCTEGCNSACSHDLECPEMTKCCNTQNKGKTCTTPLNSTLCLQQKKIAEILSTKEVDGKGYIPQCDSDGNFNSRQCSRNGKMCWCVDSIGRIIPQSLSSSQNLNCDNLSNSRVIESREFKSEGRCDINICGSVCEYGFKSDEAGCATCECNENPCEKLKCPSGSKCTFGPSLVPSCVSKSHHVNPCEVGTPLLDHFSNELLICTQDGSSCPSSHVCVKASANTDGLCCLNRPKLEGTKVGMCPFISSSLCSSGKNESSDDYQKCTSDGECEGDMKCCALPCGSVCADPLIDSSSKENTQSHLPSMCQYIGMSELAKNEASKLFRLAIPKPNCKESGEFEEIQCQDKYCYCVDEYGLEIPNTKVERSSGGNLTRAQCLENRKMSSCGDMNCRLGCDYGYKLKDGCRICECVNPCEKETTCSDSHICEMVDVDCALGNCPALPYCIPKVLAENILPMAEANVDKSCPKGAPYLMSQNETLSCRPRARMLQCPDDYFCHEILNLHDTGICCPLNQVNEEIASRNTGTQLDGNVLDDDFPINRELRLSSCEEERERRYEIQYQNGANISYIPSCDPNSGEWESVQCMTQVDMCWCVNNKGEPIKGSMGKGRVSCSSRQGRGKFLGASSLQQPSICPPTQLVHLCDKLSCENRVCLTHPQARCAIDPCGGCFLKFYDASNKEVDCEVGLSKCQTEAQRIMNSDRWMSQQKEGQRIYDEEEESVVSTAFDSIIDEIFENAAQGAKRRVARTKGSVPTIDDIWSEVVMDGNIEKIGERLSEFILSNESPHPLNIPQLINGFMGRSQNRELSSGSYPVASYSATPLMKKFSCPQPEVESILMRLTGTCTDSCNYDFECQSDERCCMLNCGYRCVKVPVEFQFEVVERRVEGKSSTVGEQLVNELQSPTMILSPPSCHKNGNYETVQSQSHFSWCVDLNGNVIPNSFTRGLVSCSPQGHILSQKKRGNICPNPQTSPMVCTNECLDAVCTTNPDAICVADPCNNCKISFYQPSGERVNCENNCFEEMDPGHCRASFKRYFYNSSSRACEEFTWGGCQGNGNNFETADECSKSCGVSIDICNLPSTIELTCDAKSERWSFDPSTDTCKKSLTCPSSFHNFKSELECNSRCPLKVLCPNMVYGELSVCDRKKACDNLFKSSSNCLNNSTGLICNVEPCSCTPSLIDLNGNSVEMGSFCDLTVSDSLDVKIEKKNEDDVNNNDEKLSLANVEKEGRKLNDENSSPSDSNDEKLSLASDEIEGRNLKDDISSESDEITESGEESTTSSPVTIVFINEISSDSDPSAVRLNSDKNSNDVLIAKEVLFKNEEFNIIAIVLTLVAAITAVLILIGLFLGMQRKKDGPMYHHKSHFESFFTLKNSSLSESSEKKEKEAYYISNDEKNSP